MYPREAARSSGLDVSLLGVIVTGFGLFLDRAADAAGTRPHLIRFFDKPPGTRYPAAMPQDKALLLLTDPATKASGPTSGGTPLISFGDLPMLIVFIGVALILAGPLWAWRQR